MRHTLRLALLLPLLLCSIQGILWYWSLYSERSVPSYLGNVSPAVPVSIGLNAPAAFLRALVLVPLGLVWGLFSQRSRPGFPGVQLVFVLFVAGSWYLIGRWLDWRPTRRDQLELSTRSIAREIGQLSVLTLGVFTLAFSFSLHIHYFSETVERALLQTWAAFLIAVPALGIIYPAARGIESARRPRRRISNSQGFIIALGVFAALLILGVLTGPHVPK